MSGQREGGHVFAKKKNAVFQGIDKVSTGHIVCLQMATTKTTTN